MVNTEPTVGHPQDLAPFQAAAFIFPMVRTVEVRYTAGTNAQAQDS